MRLSPFLPAIAAVITDAVASALVISNQPDYPLRFVIFQLLVIGLALLLAVPYRWMWLLAFVLLIGCVIVASASVGILYVPTVALSGWVMVRRLDSASRN